MLLKVSDEVGKKSLSEGAKNLKLKLLHVVFHNLLCFFSAARNQPVMGQMLFLSKSTHEKLTLAWHPIHKNIYIATVLFLRELTNLCSCYLF